MLLPPARLNRELGTGSEGDTLTGVIAQNFCANNIQYDIIMLIIIRCDFAKGCSGNFKQNIGVGTYIVGGVSQAENAGHRKKYVMFRVAGNSHRISSKLGKSALTVH